MIKRFAYIVFLLILIPWLSSANVKAPGYAVIFNKFHVLPTLIKDIPIDTVPVKTAKQLKQQEIDEKKKIKEIAKAKRLPKPEKVDKTDNSKPKPKRQRRPPGMERPPEIPRRNGN